MQVSGNKSGKYLSMVMLAASMIYNGKKVLYASTNVETECRFWIDVYAFLYKMEQDNAH